MANKDVTYIGEVAILQAGLGLKWQPQQSQPLTKEQATVLNVDGEGSLFITTPPPEPTVEPTVVVPDATPPVEANPTEQPTEAMPATATEGA